jgi:hypothetical protein
MGRRKREIQDAIISAHARGGGGDHTLFFRIRREGGGKNKVFREMVQYYQIIYW